jgi:hypothetical protein
MPLGIGSPLKERAISLSVLCVVVVKKWFKEWFVTRMKVRPRFSRYFYIPRYFKESLTQDSLIFISLCFWFFSLRVNCPSV